MASPKQTDPQFKLRMPPSLKSSLEKAVADSGRTLNAEIVWRLEQSFAYRFELGREFIQALAAASNSKIAELEEDLEELLNHHFPDALLRMSPDEYWELSMEQIGDVPDEYRPMLLEQVLKVCRLMARDPEWQPPGHGE